MFSKIIFNSIYRCLCIECIKDGFDEQQVYSSINQTSNLFSIRIGYFVEGYGTVARVVYIGTKAECFI